MFLQNSIKLMALFPTLDGSNILHHPALSSQTLGCLPNIQSNYSIIQCWNILKYNIYWGKNTQFLLGTHMDTQKETLLSTTLLVIGLTLFGLGHIECIANFLERPWKSNNSLQWQLVWRHNDGYHNLIAVYRARIDNRWSAFIATDLTFRIYE